jgi:hypothetical protein
MWALMPLKLSGTCEVYSFLTVLDRTFTHPCTGAAAGICGYPVMAGEEALQLEGFFIAHLASMPQYYFNRHINRLLSRSVAWHECCSYVWQQILQALLQNIRTLFYRYFNGGGGL